jgi:hypothetical protein
MIVQDERFDPTENMSYEEIVNQPSSKKDRKP